MSNPSPSRKPPPPHREWLAHAADYLHSFPDDHPIQIALRTYALGAFLSLSPPVMTYVVSSRIRKKGLQALLKVFRRELAVTGFAFTTAVAVGGGAALKGTLEVLEGGAYEIQKLPASIANAVNRINGLLSKLKSSHKTFMSYIISSSIAVSLLQYPTTHSVSWKARPSATLDLTLLLVVRALDSVVRANVLPSVQPPGKTLTNEERERAQTKRQKYTRRLDAFVFWACSARIMWCFFYEPHRLPRSYNKWIMSLANIDPRILTALRTIRSGDWSYVRNSSTKPELLSTFSRDIGYPAAWGDISRLPAYGGPTANVAWQTLGVKTRKNLGGIPCELVHGGLAGSSCTGNALTRGVYAFAEAMALYLPVHILPILMTRPHKLLRASELVKTLLSVLRSASFLSTFVSSIWMAVCLTRTLFLARLMPWIPHDFWDGPFGCTFAGSLVCGSSIWIEQGRRRGEMALYVLPRAIRASLSDRYLRSGKGVRLLERFAFVLSFATLLTAAWHGQDSLRGLSRWTLAFIINGPNAGFWKRKREETRPSTPSLPPTKPS